MKSRDGSVTSSGKEGNRRISVDLPIHLITRFDQLKQEWGLRGRGAVLKRLLEVVFEFKDDTLIEEVINEAVEKWLPYISINSVDTQVDAGNPNRLNVAIDFSVSTTPEATDQIVLDFNTTTTG